MRKIFERLVYFWFLWPGLFMGGCTGTTVSVLNDSELLLSISAGAVVVSLAMMAMVFVVSLVMRRFAVSMAVALSAGVSLVFGFLAAVMIGAGQHHPPRQMADEVYLPDWFDMERDDSAHVSQLGTEIEKGSWWTDGLWFYQVRQTGKTIRMEGYGLHEGGAVCAFEADGDKLRTVMPREDISTFVGPGHEVYHFLVKGTGDKEYELLLAFETEGEGSHMGPWRILQRCDDVKGDERKMLAFVEQGLCDVLEGVYTEDADSERLWMFNADGTVQMPGMDSPRPYTFELGYQMPTGVIRLPDGSRVAAVRGDDTLQLYKAAYNDDEDFWEGTDQPLRKLNVRDANTNADVAYRRPVLPGMLEFTDNTYQQMLSDRLEGVCDGMAVLNYYLLPYDNEE